MKQVFHKFWGEAVTIHAFITYNSHSTSLGHLYMLICFTAEECSFITLCYLFHEGQRKRETALFPHILSFFLQFLFEKKLSSSPSISWNMHHSQVMCNSSFLFVCACVCIMHVHASEGPMCVFRCTFLHVHVETGFVFYPLYPMRTQKRYSRSWGDQLQRTWVRFLAPMPGAHKGL